MGLFKRTKLVLRARVAVGGMVFLLLGFAACGNLFALSSVNVPLDHWSYSALDKIKGFGVIKSDIYDTRPYSRLEMARLFNEALNSEDYKNKKLPPLIDYFLDKFKSEFKMELDEVGPGEPAGKSTFFKPIEQAQAHYVYVEGEPRHFTGFPKTSSKINASEGTPLLPNNEGVVYAGQNNFSFQFASSARFLDIFSAYVEPIFIARENTRNYDDLGNFEADLLKGYAKATVHNFELEAGRDSMWLGQGYHGTLLLSNNAAPLDMVKISNPNPTVLPWYFRYLGLMKWTVFFARLDDDRDFSNPWLGGAHVVIKPSPYFEIGATSTFIFDGQGRPSLDFVDVIEMFSVGSASPNKKADQLASIDARLTLPFLRNAQIYAEFGGEDTESSRWYEFLFRDVAYIIGIYFPTVICDGRTDLRIEYANNAFKQGPSHIGFWYGHHIYTSGYTFEKMIMGHQMGPDSYDLFIRSTHYITNKLQAGIDYENLERGLTLSPTLERTNAAGADLTYDFNDWLSVSARYAYENVSNFDMVQGDDRNNHLVMTAVKVNF